MDVQNTDIHQIGSGMSTDNPIGKQQPGTSRFVLNAVNTSEGLANEGGFVASGELPADYIPLGNRYTNDGRNIILSVSANERYSQIGLVDKNSKYTTIVNSTELGFKLNHQIDIRYRLRRGCEDVIYFTDAYGKMRYFNFSKPEQFYTEAYEKWLLNPTGAFTGIQWDVEQFSLFPSYEIPCFTGMDVLVGGAVKSGTFNFGIQLEDDNLNPTNFIYTSQPVAIYAASQTGDFNSIIGSSNSDVDELAGSDHTNKSIRLTLGNLDPHYKFYRVAVIEATSKTGEVSRVLLSPSIPISRTEFTFDGNIQGYTQITEAELAISKIDIEVVEHLEQIENKLILANVQGKQVDYCSFQRYASKIATSYVIREAEAANSLDSGNPKSPHTYWERVGYMGGEVYAPGIVYVFSNGLESPAFHIPGRPLGKYYNTQLDKIELTPHESEIIETWNKDVAFIESNPDTYNALPPSKKAKRYQVYNTAVKYSQNTFESFGAMAYHQNENVYYEERNSCGGPLDYWGLDCCGEPLAGKNIRHHKFPSRALEPHVREGSFYQGKTGLYIDVNLREGKTFPETGVYSITIEYEANGVPKEKTITLDPDEFPIGKVLIETVEGGFENIIFIAASGNVVDYEDTFAYLTYKDEVSTLTNDTTIIRHLGFKFDNIEYPHPDIVGHYFVRANRDEQNRTVLDKGFAGRLRAKQLDEQLYTSFSYFNDHIGSSDQTDDNFLFTPRNMFNKDTLAVDYLKLEGEFVCESMFTGSKEEDGEGSALKEVNSIIEWRNQSYGNFVPNPTGENWRVTAKTTLDATAKDLQYNGIQSPLYNLSWSNRVNVVSTQEYLKANGRNMNYVSVNVNRNVHPVLDDIVYQRMHNCMLIPANSNVVFGGDVYISRWDIANSLYSRQKKGILKTLLNIVLIAGAVVATVATAGAAGAALAPMIGAVIAGASAAGIASAVAVTALIAGAIGVTANTIQMITDEIENGVLSEMTTDFDMKHATGTGIRFSAYVAYANEIMQGLYVESEVNVALSQDEKHVCGSGYRSQTGVYEYFRSRWLYFDPDKGKWTPKGIACPEVYNYNKDYSRENEQSKYFALPATYDCCSDCKESHPNRVVWSEEAFQEELTDNYRVFKPNNYRDIDAEHGEITSIIKRNNNLFIQTSEALWLLPQSTQERVTNEIVSFIGTGDFFSLPVKKLLDSELGVAGTQHKWANINTPKGLLTVNELESKVYLYDQGFNEISKIGRKFWFKDNLKDNFARQFEQITGEVFPNQNNPANPFGTGIHSTYDAAFDRVLITKRDYLLLPAFVESLQVVSSSNNLMPELAPGTFVFDRTTRKFVLTGANPGNYQFIDFNNSTYFQSKSFTVSFYLKEREESWTSMHSYIPNFYFYTHEELYSIVAGNKTIWKHNDKYTFNKYYGVAHPFIIEQVLVTDGTTTQYWTDLQLQTTARQFDRDTQEFVDVRNVTFNKIIAYNNRQSTGELSIRFKLDDLDEDFFYSQIVDTPGQVIADRNEIDWTLNDFRDFVLDPTKSLFTSDWESVKNNFYIDKIVNRDNISYEKDWIEQESLRDKYLIVRLKFDNFTDVQLIAHYIVDSKGISFR